MKKSRRQVDVRRRKVEERRRQVGIKRRKVEESRRLVGVRRRKVRETRKTSRKTKALRIKYQDDRTLFSTKNLTRSTNIWAVMNKTKIFSS